MANEKDLKLVFKYSEKKLAKEIQNEVKLIDPTLKCTYLPAEREVVFTKLDDGTYGPSSLFLGNIFLNVSKMPKKERIELVRSFVGDSLAPQELSADETMASLVLRTRTDFELYFRNRNLAIRGHDPSPSIAVSRGEFLVEVVADGDKTLSVPKPSDLSEIGVTEEEAFRIAVAKTRRVTDEDQWEEIEESIWVSRYQDDYDFARLVAAEEKAKYPFDGQPIVFAPSHSICLATDNENAAVLTRMIDIGNEYSATHRRFSQKLWTPRSGTDWRAWQPDVTSASTSVASLQQIRESSHIYEETQTYLQRKLGDDIFVATYNAIGNEGTYISYFTYTFDLPSYLPLTDLVALVDPGRPEDEQLVGWVTWQEFESCLSEDLNRSSDISIPVWFQVTKGLGLNQQQCLVDLARPEPTFSSQ